jgi:serine/threonine protein kinase
VNQFFNKAEPRHSLRPSPALSASNLNPPASPEPVGLGPIEEELDFEDFEIGEATASESSDVEGSRYDWELQSSDVAICKRSDGRPWSLGKGGFGEVFKALRDGVDEVAVKIIRISNCTPKVVAQFKAEIDLISKLRHRNIVQFYGACIQPQDLYMVTELMNNDLFSILRLPRQAEKYKWSGLYGRDVLIGVASGLNYLHSRNPAVVHRDVKSPNILVMEGVAKIADVGVARTMGHNAPDMTAQRGFTIAWAAPEVVYRRRATEKIDIWSLGVIMWEVVSGKLPRPGTLALPSDCPQQLKVLYSRCMSDSPAGRPSALEVITKLRSIRE